LAAAWGAVGWLCLVSLRVGLSVISEFCVLATGSSPYRFRGLWKLWLGRLVAVDGFSFGIVPCRSASLLAVCWLGVFVGLSVSLLLCGCRSGFLPSVFGLSGLG